MNYEELYHHGIKGMKWGVRRYQNADGSLTREGKKHLRNNLYSEYRKGGTSKLTAKIASFRDSNYYSQYSKAEESAKARKAKIEDKLSKTPAETRKAQRLGKKWVRARASEIHADRLQQDLMENSDAVNKYLKRVALGSMIDGGFGIVASYLESRDDNSWTNRVNESYYNAKSQAKQEYKERQK